MKNDWFLWVCSFALISLVLGLGFSKKAHAETNTVSNSTVTVDNTHLLRSHQVLMHNLICVVPGVWSSSINCNWY